MLCFLGQLGCQWAFVSEEPLNKLLWFDTFVHSSFLWIYWQEFCEDCEYALSTCTTPWLTLVMIFCAHNKTNTLMCTLDDGFKPHFLMIILMFMSSLAFVPATTRSTYLGWVQFLHCFLQYLYKNYLVTVHYFCHAFDYCFAKFLNPALWRELSTYSTGYHFVAWLH